MKTMGKIAKSSFFASVFVSTLVFLIIMGLRITGSLESLELTAYDWVITLQPEAPDPDPRIVLITITESDIQKLGQWPISDATLAEVLTRLVDYEPRAIGFDVYRDIPVPPGHEKLNEVLTRNRHIIAVTKFGGGESRGVPPPPVLKNTDQVGFSDMVVDPGGIVRRGTLFLDDGKTLYYSFDLRLAMLYLQAEGIMPQPDASNPEFIKLGKTTIRPFESNNGGYVGADSGGYQFLLDLKSAQKEFLSYSLTTLLSEKIDPDSIKDKTVMIGVSAESVKDSFYISSNRGMKIHQKISGVALHGHIASQLLRFSLEGQRPVATTDGWAAVIWILIWSFMGGMASLGARSTWRF
jgi:adenylate cyclase